MTQEYTPTDEVIKDAACFPKPTRLGEPYPIDPSDYDRWLAAHDAQIRAEVWDEGHTRGWIDGMENTEPTSSNPYRKENYLYKSNGLQREEEQQ